MEGAARSLLGDQSDFLQQTLAECAQAGPGLGEGSGKEVPA